MLYVTIWADGSWVTKAASCSVFQQYLKHASRWSGVGLMLCCLQWLKCKFGGPGTLCGLRGPYHSVGGPLHSIWGPVIWLLYSSVMLKIPQQYWKLAYVMKLQHTFKILQQRYFITVNMANIGIIRHNIPQCCIPVAPELRSGKNYDRWGPRNGLSQFLGPKNSVLPRSGPL